MKINKTPRDYPSLYEREFKKTMNEVVTIEVLFKTQGSRERRRRSHPLENQPVGKFLN